MASGHLINIKEKKSQKHIPPIVENLKEQHSFAHTTLLLQVWHYFGFHKLEMADSVDLRRLNHNFIRLDQFFHYQLY